MASARNVVVMVSALTAASAHAQVIQLVAPEKVGLSTERLGRVGVYLNEQVEKGRLPGAVVLVARKGKIAYFESFGFQDPETRKRMAKDSVFRVHSATKAWVSVAAMMLLEEGRLQLGDPVSKWLPAFKTMQVSVPRVDPKSGGFEFATVPAEREMTIYDLLRHTSGLTYGMWTENVPVREAYTKAGLGATPASDIRALTPAEVIERLSKVPLVQQPGTTWEYGHSTDLLGLVIEAIEGARLGDVLRRRIFGPLGMTDSGFWLPQERLDRLAQPLSAEPGSGKRVEYIDVSAPPKLDAGGHGGVSTAIDYLRFCQMLLQGGKLDGARILSRSSVALMSTDQLGSSVRAPTVMAMGSTGYTWGLGFAVRRDDAPATILGSPGEFLWGGAPSGMAFWIDPREQMVGIFLTAATWSDYGVYRRAVKQMIHAAVAD